MRWACLLALVAGCKTNLEGWWDVTAWEVERDGTSDAAVGDAGFVVWQEGSATVALSYLYDPVAIDLVPDPDPDVSGGATSLEDFEWTDEGEMDLSVWVPTATQPEPTFQVDFDLVEDHGTELELESTFTSDGSTWRWVIHR